METINLLENLRNINTESLAKVMNISSNMARKYKREPWKYDPPTTKAVAVEESFGIPVFFWKNVKFFHIESLSEEEAKNKYRKEV